MSRILITGCSKGLGRATALELARGGHEVVAAARKIETLVHLPVAARIALDVTSDASVRLAVEQSGPVDVVTPSSAACTLPIRIRLTPSNPLPETTLFSGFVDLSAHHRPRVVPGKQLGTVLSLDTPPVHLPTRMSGEPNQEAENEREPFQRAVPRRIGRDDGGRMNPSAHPDGSESQQDAEVTSQTGAVSLLAATKRILEMIAAGAGLTDILANLCATIDAQSPDMMSMVMLMDPDSQRLWPASAPRVPSDWTDALTPLMIGPNMGSCGTAAFRKERVIISDLATDPLMSGLSDGQSREAALARGLRAAWSQPLISKDNEVLGTFGVVSVNWWKMVGRHRR
jgi:hypothetical protein